MVHSFDRQVIVMLVVLLVVFAVCWLPFQVVIMYTEHYMNGAQKVSSCI